MIKKTQQLKRCDDALLQVYEKIMQKPANDIW